MKDVDASVEGNPLDAMAEEFVERYRRGERPALSEYIARQPELAEGIRDLFPALVMLENARPASAQDSGGLAGVSNSGSGTRLARLGDYRILREIGRGGMGIVYEAEQEALGRHVALKVLPKHAMLDPRQLERFHREARAAARLHHTNIVPVFGVGEHDGLHYHVMQFIQGLGLDEVLVEVVRLRDEKHSSAQASKRGSAELVSHASGDRANRRDGKDAGALSAAQVAEALISGQFQPAAEGSVAPREPSTSSAEASALVGRALLPVAEPDPGKSARPTTDTSTTDTSTTDSSSGIHLPGQGSNTTESGGAYWNSVARIGVQVAEALAYANSQGVLHRDVKPSNLLLDTSGSVWVTDFGLAKTSDSEDLTRTGDIVGTLRYMAPERFLGRSDLRCDIYSLGMTLYELLTLRHPFAESDRHKLVRQIAQEDPPRPRSFDRSLPRDLETIVLKAIAKQPADRYQSAELLAADLRRFIEDKPIQARRIGRTERLWRWGRRNPLVASLSVSLALLVTVLGVGMAIANFLRTQRDRAIVGEVRAKRAEGEVRDLLDRALSAEREVKIRSHLAQAAAYRHGGQPGRRYKSLGELTEAVKLNPTGPIQAELRDEAIACMALMDLRAVDVSVLAGPPLTFDRSYRQYAFFDDEAKIHIRRVGEPNDKCVLPGLGHTNLSISFSPSGQYVETYTAGGGPTQIWHIESGRAVFQEPIHSYAGNVSPDERCVAISLLNASAAVYELPSGRELAHLPTDTVPSAIAIHPDGRRVAVGLSRPPRLWIWDRDQKAVVAKLTDIGSPIHAVGWDSAGLRLALALATPANRAEIWDLATWKRLAIFEGHAQDVTVAQFHASGSLLATGSWDGFTRVWDASSARHLVAWPGVMQGWPDRSGRVIGHVLNRNRTQLIELIAADEYQTLVSSLGAGQGQYRDGSISPDGRLLALGMDDGVRIWDLPTSREVAYLPTEQTPSPMFSQDGKELIISGDSGLQRWPLAPRVSGAALAAGVFPLESTRTTPVASANPLTPAPRIEVEIVIGPPRTVPLPNVPLYSHGTPDGRTLAVCTPRSGQGLIVDLADDRLQATLAPHSGLSRIVLSPDGRWAATTGWHAATVRVWDARTAVLVNEFPLGTMTLAAFSPDSLHFITSRFDEFCFWEVGSWRKTKTFSREHCPFPGSVAFSPDGLMMALELSSGIISLVKSETGATLAKLEDPYHDRPNWMSFTPDGSRLVVASTYAKNIHVWDLNSIRRQLANMGLDWDALPVLQPATVAEVEVPRVSVDLGDFGPRAEAVRKNKQSKAHFDLAKEHLQSQRWAEAVTEFKRAVEVSSENATYHNGLAWLLATCPDPVYRDGPLAIEHARRAVKLAADLPESWNTLGVAFYRSGEWQQAIEMLTKAEQLKPDTYFGHNGFFLAMAHWQLGETEAARKLFDQADQWLESTKSTPHDRDELKSFRAEAEELLRT